MESLVDVTLTRKGEINFNIRFMLLLVQKNDEEYNFRYLELEMSTLRAVLMLMLSNHGNCVFTCVATIVHELQASNFNIFFF
jgi:hypothetical protein